MKQAIGFGIEKKRITSAFECLNPAEPDVSCKGCTLANREVRCGITACAIVAKVGHGKTRRVLEVGGRAISLRRRERIIRAIDRSRQRQWRKTVAVPQCRESRLIADTEVDAEVHVTCIYAVQLEAVVQAHRRALEQLPGERRARSETVVDVDARRTSAVREQAERELVLRRTEPRLSKIEARTVRRREVTRALIDDSAEDVAKDEPAVEAAREKVARRQSAARADGPGRESRSV